MVPLLLGVLALLIVVLLAIAVWGHRDLSWTVARFAAEVRAARVDAARRVLSAESELDDNVRRVEEEEL